MGRVPTQDTTTQGSTEMKKHDAAQSITEALWYHYGAEGVETEADAVSDMLSKSIRVHLRRGDHFEASQAIKQKYPHLYIPKGATHTQIIKGFVQCAEKFARLHTH